MELFSAKLKLLRLEKMENQNDVAVLCGVSVQSYSAYENGREPNYDLLCKLSDHFGVTIDYLLGRTNKRKAENVDIADKLGLSETAIDTLADLKSRDPANSVTLTVNALIENRYALHAIGKYLYYDLNKSNSVVPYNEVYKYINHCVDSSWWGKTEQYPVDVEITIDAINNEVYRKVQLLNVQEELEKLLQHENEIERYPIAETDEEEGEEGEDDE